MKVRNLIWAAAFLPVVSFGFHHKGGCGHEEACKKTFAGTGTLTSSCGHNGTIHFKRDFTTNQMESVATVGSKIIKRTLSAKMRRNGFFDVISNTKTVGSGFCVKGACHYHAKFETCPTDSGCCEGCGKAEFVEETLTFSKDGIDVLGTKKDASCQYAWRASLIKGPKPAELP